MPIAQLVLRFLLVSLVFGSVVPLHAEDLTTDEIFTLRDGRTLTGTYDESTHVLTFQSGRISGSTTVRPKDILSRQPADAATEEPEDDGLEDLLLLKDGRKLRGTYESTTNKITLSGKVVATISVDPDEIVEHKRVSPLKDSKPKGDRKTWLSDQIGGLHKTLRSTKESIFKMEEQLKLATPALPLAGTQLEKMKKALSNADSTYRKAMKERDTYLAANRTKPVPSDMQDRIRKLEGTFRNSRIAVAEQIDRIAGIEKDIKRLTKDIDAEQAKMRATDERLEKLQQALMEERQKK